MSQSATAPGCPICGKPRDAVARPFCSKRCADIDLGRWLNGSYAIPSEEGPDGEASESPDIRRE
ncbi:MAG: DNA gyrase inhibitor YacG [Pseudomonadota bacterium]